MSADYPDCHKADKFGDQYRCSTNCQYGQECPHGFQSISLISRKEETNG